MKKYLLLFIFFVPHLSIAGPLQDGTPAEKIAHMDSLVSNKAQLSQKTIKALGWILSDGNQTVLVRERAAWTIGQLKLYKLNVSLITATKSKSLLIRAAAIDALIHWRAKSALSAYIDIAENDPVLSMKQRATIALGLTRSDKAIQPLVDLSSSEIPALRAAACLSMGALHSKKNNFSELMKEMTQDKDPYVSRRAQKSIDVINRDNAKVREHFESDDIDIKLFAARYLHFHGKSSDLATLKKYVSLEKDEVKYEIEQAILSINKRIKAEKKRKEAARKEAQRKKALAEKKKQVTE